MVALFWPCPRCRDDGPRQEGHLVDLAVDGKTREAGIRITCGHCSDVRNFLRIDGEWQEVEFGANSN